MTRLQASFTGQARREPSRAIIGSSLALRTAVELARKAAPTDMPVLILGETGTGKELLARLIHREGSRSGRLVAVDCGALPDDLVESLLFGHRRGAFTGAVEHSSGLMAEADQGTLFMDELGSLSKRGQSKLLRALETGVVRRVGEARDRLVNFRLVATAQQDLGCMMREGRFRDDLVQRLAGVVVQLPSLRDRGEDVILLADHFAQGEGLMLDEAARRLLALREWPGNVRELKWLMARCALFAIDGCITTHAVRMAMEVGPDLLVAPDQPPTKEAELRTLCEMHQGDADEVAAALGVGRSTLYRRLKRAGLELGRFRRAVSSG